MMKRCPTLRISIAAVCLLQASLVTGVVLAEEFDQGRQIERPGFVADQRDPFLR